MMLPPSTLYGFILTIVVVSAGVTLVLSPGQAAISIPLFSMVALGVLNLLQGAAAANKVAEVKTTLTQTAEVASKQVAELTTTAVHTQQTVQAVHTLVNSATGLQLKSNAVLARRLADYTKDPADIAVAVESERVYDDHQAKQALVDANPPPAPVAPGAAPDTAPVFVEEISLSAAKTIAEALTLPKEKETES